MTIADLKRRPRSEHPAQAQPTSVRHCHDGRTRQ